MCGLKSSDSTKPIFCRSCRGVLRLGKSLNLQRNYKSLSGKSKYLVDIFYECTGVDLRRDTLSKCLCQKCASILIAAYEFKLMTQVSQKAMVVEDVIKIKQEITDENDHKTLISNGVTESNVMLEKENIQKYIRKNRNQWKAHRCPAFGCNLIFRFNIDLKRHITEMNGTENHIFHCELCEKRYGTKDNVRCHLQQFHKEYKCIECKTIIKGRHNLYVHRRKFHVKKSEIICIECGKTFLNNDILKRHINGVHRKQLNYECHICGQRCQTSSNLRTHALIHTNILSFVCDICNKAFKQMANLKLHKQTHVKVNAFECDVCRLKLKTKAYLREHRKLHFVSTDYKCDECKSSFKRPAYLREHKKLMHTNVVRVTCATCGASYKSKKFLIIHMRQHTDTGYSCDQCGRKYNQKHVLRDHIVAVHDKVKNFVCVYEGCEKRYFTVSNLSHHVKTIHLIK